VEILIPERLRGRHQARRESYMEAAGKLMMRQAPIAGARTAASFPATSTSAAADQPRSPVDGRGARHDRGQQQEDRLREPCATRAA